MHLSYLKYRISNADDVFRGLDIHQDICDVLFTGVNAGAASCSICQFWYFYFQCLL